MMSIENDYHYRHWQRMMAEFQDNVALHLEHPDLDWDRARLVNECRLIQYDIEKCRFQMRAYEDFSEGRTATLRNPTGDALHALAKRMWADAGRIIEKRISARESSDKRETPTATGPRPRPCSHRRL